MIGCMQLLFTAKGVFFSTVVLIVLTVLTKVSGQVGFDRIERKQEELCVLAHSVFRDDAFANFSPFEFLSAINTLSITVTLVSSKSNGLVFTVWQRTDRIPIGAHLRYHQIAILLITLQTLTTPIFVRVCYLDNDARPYCSFEVRPIWST